MRMHRYQISSESTTEGHPDKIADQISDAVLDAIIAEDPPARVACETFVTVGLVIIGGEITTSCYVDLNKLVREVIRDIGYTAPSYGFNSESCCVLNAIGKQSPDIAQGVDIGGAGDQGVMIGYAANETPEFMPMPIMLAHRLTRRLAEVRKNKILDYLGPDGKSLVTVDYVDGKPNRVDTVIMAAQHNESVLTPDKRAMSEDAKEEIKEQVIRAVIGPEMLDARTKYFINETGKFVIGGPQSDTGMTGRKNIVDTYGGVVPHGGGAFSGKDPSKVDRSASYMARYIAKNIVAANLAEKCKVELTYVIGKAEPTSVVIDTMGTGKIPEERLKKAVMDNFDLTLAGVIRDLKLRRPIYRKTACYGHFGRQEEGFTWEEVDKAPILKRLIE